MNGRRVLAALAAVVAATMAGTALAASTAKDPKTLVLQKSDFPAGVREWRKPVRDKSPQGSNYAVYYRYKSGSKTFDLTSTAFVTTPRLAKIGFKELSSLVRPIEGYRTISLPKYGDEQAAGLDRSDNAPELWVRKGGTVWGIGVLGPISRADAIAQLKLYAPKQAKRVGSG